MIVFLLLIALGIGTAAWLVLEPVFVRQRRARLLEAPMPAHWPAWMDRHAPGLAPAPPALKARVAALAQVFVHEKRFVGCNGLVVTEEMRVAIALQACLLIAGRPGVPRHGLYDELRSILVYPAAFVVEELRHHGGGVVSQERRTLSGQAWDAQRIVLSWDDIEFPEPGQHVVLHEFAHYLDMENESMDGTPQLGNAAAYRRWASAFREAYRLLHEDLAAGRPTLLDPYGAAEPAEFFAVATEAFLMQPQEMATLHPRLYAPLSDYFGLDPASWTVPTDAADQGKAGESVPLSPAR